MVHRCLVLLAVLLWPAFAMAVPSVIEGQARVIDGDTVTVGGVRVRLFGIDAPEKHQTCDLDGTPWACGAFATARLRAEIGSKPVTCAVVVAADRYGRPVAVCHAQGRDLGAAMVAAGAAVAFRRYSDRYIATEAAARVARRGVWMGGMVAPEVARANGQHTALSASGGCAIKGNISAKGERIYHMPGQQFYAATRIDKPGEGMFCTEQDARAAGFRRAKR